MIAQITDNHFIYLGQITQGSEEALVKWFSARSPQAFFRKNDLWDGWYRKYNTVKQRLALPYLAELKRCCKAHDIPLEIVDQRPAPKYPAPQPNQITNTLVPGVILEDYQVRGLQACCVEEIGVLRGSTGSGKTEQMCGLVKMFRCPTVIITEQIVVLEQIVKRLKMRQVVHNNDIGLFCHGCMPDGNLVIVGSIQSLSSPKRPKPTDIKVTTKEAISRCIKWATNKTMTIDETLMLYRVFPKALADALYEVPNGCYKLRGTYLDLLVQFVRRVKYNQIMKWYKSRITKAKQIQEMVSKCDLLLVDEVDLAVTSQYALLFKNYFHGRRRYGFCLDGSTLVTTPFGDKQLNKLPLGEVSILANNGVFDVFAKGELIQTKIREQYRVVSESGFLLTSGDHLIAKNNGSYIRIQDIRPGEFIKIQDDAFIDDLEYLTGLFTEIESSSDFGLISRETLELSYSDLNKNITNTKIDNIIPIAIKFITDSRKLSTKFKIVSVKKLHKQQFIGGSKVEQSPCGAEIISSLEFSRDLNSTRGISFAKCITDFLSNFGVIDGITTEFLMKNIEPFLDLIWSQEYNGSTISLYHSVLESLNNFGKFHRIINTISLKTSNLPFNFIIERLTTVNYESPCPRLFLVCRNRKPVIYAVLLGHFLFIGFERVLSSLDYMRKFFNTIAAQVSTESFKLTKWACVKALEDSRAIITANSSDIKISNFAMIPFSFNDHRLLSLKGVPIYFCQKVDQIKSINKTGKAKKMYDIIDVKGCSNFYANGILVHNSATPFEKSKPVENLILREHMGNIIYEAPRQEVQAAGRIIPIRFHMIAVGPEDRHDSRTYDIAMKEIMIENEEFHQLVAQIVFSFPKDGTLILVDTSPIEELGVALERIIPNSKFIFGNTPKKIRRKCIESFERREMTCLIGSKILKRGLDLSGGVENLIIIGGGAKWSDFDQKVGRAVRLNSRGWARVFSFFFLCNKYLYRHSKESLKALLNMGYEAHIHVNGIDLDGAKFVRSNFRLPKS